MLSFLGMKVRDAVIAEAAKFVVDNIPCMTAREKQFTKDVINGISIAKTACDVAYLINDRHQRSYYSYPSCY